mmetsp:Transcript_17586/g.31714  ORF Transcript_17586/g.31714 Transcript_17586/m.31714 type:complete len:120 (+) Transcript_17586:3235-3594(+)
MQKIFKSSKLRTSEVQFEQTQFLPVVLKSTKAALNFTTGSWLNHGELSKYTAALEDEKRKLTDQITEARVTQGLLEQLLQSKASALEKVRDEVREFLRNHEEKLSARGVPVAELLEPIS